MHTKLRAEVKKTATKLKNFGEHPEQIYQMLFYSPFPEDLHTVIISVLLELFGSELTPLTLEWIVRRAVKREYLQLYNNLKRHESKEWMPDFPPIEGMPEYVEKVVQRLKPALNDSSYF